RRKSRAMSLLIDLFGYLSVLLQGFDMVAQAVLIGSALFLLFEAGVLAPAGNVTAAFLQGADRVLALAALAAALAVLAGLALNEAVLMGSLSLNFTDTLDADFLRA